MQLSSSHPGPLAPISWLQGITCLNACSSDGACARLSTSTLVTSWHSAVSSGWSGRTSTSCGCPSSRESRGGASQHPGRASHLQPQPCPPPGPAPARHTHSQPGSRATKRSKGTRGAAARGPPSSLRGKIPS